jgi:hypothetical protein
MNDKDEPRRLFDSDDAPTGLRTLLVRAHEDVAPDAVVAQLLGRVERQAAMPGSSGRWAARRSTKLLLAVALVGAGGAVWFGAARDRAAAPVVVSPPEMPRLEQGRAQNPVMEAPVPSDTSGGRAPAAETVLPSRTHAGSNRSPRAVRSRGAGETETAVSTGTEPASGEEYALLRAARRALADDPARALQFTDQHRRRFTQGMLMQEREAIAVEALARLGRTSDVKVRAQAFFATFPSSPYRGRVERAVASLPVEKK